MAVVIHVVVIAEDDGAYFVAPASAIVSRDDKVMFVNMTSDNFTVEFPGGTNPFNEAVGTVVAGQKTELDVKGNSGCYPYQASNQSGAYAQASAPRIIILPAAP